jgi:drug/metabolite transporter (DMT)-like permease
LNELQGVFVTGAAYGLQIWCIEKKGPFYVSMFSPLALVLTAIFSAILWAERLNWQRFVAFKGKIQIVIITTIKVFLIVQPS